jgi:DNA-binding response OmpR family regulator
MKTLIAEDDFTSRVVLVGVLKKSGHEVVETVDGNDAWEALQRPDAPALAIIDWMMPGLDGLDVVRRVRALKTDQQPYLIMLTNKADKADILAGFDAGANDYVSKPFDPGELLIRIEVGRRLLEMRDALAIKSAELQEALRQLAILRGNPLSVAGAGLKAGD